MARYLVIHTPRADADDMTRPPTRLTELAAAHGVEGAEPRWIRAWSPDLHDDRLFTMWEAANADQIRTTIATFGFLDDMDVEAVAVHEWGPEDVPPVK
jgi:hypothetical protein